MVMEFWFTAAAMCPPVLKQHSGQPLTLNSFTALHAAAVEAWMQPDALCVVAAQALGGRHQLRRCRCPCHTRNSTEHGHWDCGEQRSAPWAERDEACMHSLAAGGCAWQVRGC